MNVDRSDGSTAVESDWRRARDWAVSPRGYLAGWGLPSLILIGAGFLAPGARALIWSGVLVWMGLACLVNAQRCGRIHCRYTGPYYLLLIPPTALLGVGFSATGSWAWWVLGAMILLGAKLIWLATELLWGRYRT